MPRLLAVFSILALLAGCAGNQTIDETSRADLGAFRLGHNIVIASKMQKVPVSREATQEEWVEGLTAAFEDRFGRYEGDQLYHFGISVEGYALAPPGVPLVATPKSAVVLNITVWDDAEGKKLNEKPHQLLVFESLGEGFIVGSGLTSTGEEQLANLSFNAARELEKWLSRQHREQGWFASKPGSEVSAEAVGETASGVSSAATDGAGTARGGAETSVTEILEES
ncbi:hypothetical protein [Aestuariivita sp.]|jgi:hypothetical protein|uniref:hypothetical protein n=1 Tax=Aestuariivita sp. TaxID=1872407 RepID=UPI0025BD8E21|nr:hypothetical protein [Aestuariivita sp.]